MPHSHSTSIRIHIPSPWTQHKTQMKTGGNWTASSGFQGRFHQHSFYSQAPEHHRTHSQGHSFQKSSHSPLGPLGHASQSTCMGICTFGPRAQRGLHRTMVLFPQLQPYRTHMEIWHSTPQVHPWTLALQITAPVSSKLFLASIIILNDP